MNKAVNHEVVVSAPQVHRFAAATRIVKSAKDRQKLVAGRDRDYLVAAIVDELEKSGATVLSLDVFDTLLLRNKKPEALRFEEISQSWARLLNGDNRFGIANAPAAHDLLVARARAMQTSYTVKRPINAHVEGEILDIVRAVCRSLALPPSVTKYFVKAEIEYEAENLAENTVLTEVAGKFSRKKGRKVILVSDMYLRSGDILGLVRKVAPSMLDLIDFVHSSADVGVNKRSGSAFDFICRQMRRPPKSFFHVGDNFTSDYRNAKLHGWGAFHFPVSDEEIRIRKAGLERWIRAMEAIGLDVRSWAKI